MSRTPSEVDEVACEIASGGGKARTLPLDVTRSDAVRDAFAGLGRLEILVNNAGLNRPQPFLAVDEPTLDLLLGLNVRAAFIVAQAAARLMVAEGAGVIINVSSQMGHVGSERDRTVYVMTKHALEGLTKAMAVELAPQGVRVVSIAPTFVATPLSKPFLDDPDTRWILSYSTRSGHGREVASALPRLARRRPRHWLEPARRRRLDRLVISSRMSLRAQRSNLVPSGFGLVEIASSLCGLLAMTSQR